MDEHRKVAEEIVNPYRPWEIIVKDVEVALRSTASKSEKDGYDRGRKDGRLLLEKIGRPLKAWESLFKNWEGDIQVRGLPAQIECGTCIEKTKEALAIIEKEGGE
jgi:hypothetical protein